MDNFINLTLDNIDNEHLCCIIRSKTLHPGVEEKRKWLKERIKEGHVFRKLDAKATVFVEYAPLEKAWVPVEGSNYYYIYCLWVLGDFKGKGYGKSLMEYVIDDARRNNKSGICLLGSKKQKTWLQDQTFAKKFGFEVVDTTSNDYELLALSFDGSFPRFSEKTKTLKIDNDELTVYYDSQCPYTYQTIEIIKNYCNDNDIPCSIIKINSLEEAKNLPCVFNNYAVFYKGKFETVNLLDLNYLKRILKRG